MPALALWLELSSLDISMAPSIPACKLLEIRTPKVTTEDTETENCLSKANLLLQMGAQAQQARGAGNRSSFLFLMLWALPLYLDWSSSGAQSGCN
jgi:hypothetical protein